MQGNNKNRHTHNTMWIIDEKAGPHKRKGEVQKILQKASAYKGKRIVIFF